MKISTRGRYAIMLMLELALDNTGEFITIKSISEKQNISDKYLEQIINVLSRSGFVKSKRGSQGGYKLSKPAEKYTIGMILRLIEGSLVPIACMEDDPNQCPRCNQCVTLDIWKKLDEAISSVVDNITIADLAQKQKAKILFIEDKADNAV
ncbi:MAG: Rrf2 family transcriptional regulator [Lachnospiraceae bacterium]|nr:Rrf2 family transcriptional regulator [Lachnospiraceae bacterium]